MRFFTFLLLAAVSAAAPGAPEGPGHFKHAWVQGPRDHGVFQMTSSYTVPIPASDRRIPEAVLGVKSRENTGKLTLNTIVEREIAAIRDNNALADYLEHDGHAPRAGVVSYVEKMHGVPVAFIKYRATGDKHSTLPPSLTLGATRALLLKDGMVVSVDLFTMGTLALNHQQDVRADQIALIREILGFAPGERARKPAHPSKDSG